MKSLDNTPALETIYARILRLELKHITLCSSNRRSGNSTIALALAKRAAQSGKRVLLIELNVYSPCIHRWLNLDRTEWLPLTGHWEHAAQPTHQPGLLFLPSPEKSSHCVEFRDQETLKLFFESCEQRFDLIICDSAPLLMNSCEFDDALNFTKDVIPIDTLCAASKATLLTVITGRTTETQVNDCREILKQSGAFLVGVIMNDQFAPDLKQELIRETRRLDRLFPNWMEKVRQGLSRMILLNQEL